MQEDEDQQSPSSYRGPFDNLFLYAVRYATEEWKVHIISISLGFEVEHVCIKEAINLAFKQGVIIFAAASNDGANRSVMEGLPFPACMPEVICINSCDGNGTAPSKFNPPPVDGSFNFLTLGESVPVQVEWPTGTEKIRLTGTSFAAPVATAIAALLIEFLLQKPLRRQPELRKKALCRDGMIKLFAGMSKSVAGGFQYLLPWSLIECTIKDGEKQSSHDCGKTCRVTAAKNIEDCLNGPFPTSTPLPNLLHDVEAEFDSQTQIDVRGQCLPGTRSKLLEDISSWIDDPKGDRIAWLIGRAGSGKSAIARTVAMRLAETERLGASFFFARGRGTPSVSLFITSIAYQLARHRPQLVSLINRTLKAEPDLARPEKAQLIQWTRLVLDPLRSDTSHIVLVVDGLDEFSEPSTMWDLLRRLGEFKARVQVVITGRRESLNEIDLNGSGVCFDLDSQAITETAHADISLYIQKDLSTLASIPLDDQIIDGLASKSAGLFIYAKVACSYIRGDGDPRGRHRSTVPRQRLEQVLTDQRFEGLDALYSQILIQAAEGPDQQEVSEHLRHILEVIVALFEPMPESFFHQLCEGEMLPETVSARLRSLQSVLVVRETPDQAVQIFHDSFREYILRTGSLAGESRNEGCLAVNVAVAHRNLFNRCIQFMAGSEASGQRAGLEQDPCRLGKVGTSIESVSEALVQKHIDRTVRYACQYWIEHLEETVDSPQITQEMQPSDYRTAQQFFESHLLHWIEALSLMQMIDSAIASLQKLQALLKRSTEASDFGVLVGEAYCFMQSHRWTITHWPLQVYVSALVFSPASSRIKRLFDPVRPSWIAAQPFLDENWSSLEPLVETGHPVKTLCFAPNSTSIAAADESAISVWDYSTRQCHYLPENTADSRAIPVWHVTLSRDSQLLAAASSASNAVDTLTSKRLGALDRYRIVIRELKPDGKLRVLPGHRSPIKCITFSFDSKFFASTAEDGVLRIWDVESGDCTKELQVTNPMRVQEKIEMPVVFSRESSAIVAVAASPGPSILKRWNWKLSTEGPHDIRIDSKATSVVLSEDGNLAAVTLRKGVVEVWEIASGNRLHSVDHQGHSVHRVVFSADGKKLASVSETIQVWNTWTGEAVCSLAGIGASPQIVFSPDLGLLASTRTVGSNFIEVWDIQEGCLRDTLIHGTEWIRSLTFSHDSSFLAGATGKRFFLLWNMLPQRAKEPIIVSTTKSTTSWLKRVFNPHSTTGRLEHRDTSEVSMQVRQRHVETHGKAAITAMHFSLDAEVLVTASDDGMVKFIHTATGTCFKELKTSSKERRVAFCASKGLLAWDRDEEIEIRDVATGKRKGKSFKSLMKMSPVAFSPSGTRLAIANEFVRLVVWNIEEHRQTATWQKFSTTDPVAFSADEKHIAVVSEGCTVKVIDAQNGKECQTLVHPVSAQSKITVNNIAFSKNSTNVAVSLSSGIIVLWNATTERPQHTIKVPSGARPAMTQTMRFDDTGSKLITRLGILHLGTSVDFTPESETYEVEASGEWILWHHTGTVQAEAGEE
ncbi:unnamed protein product [Clonostachys rosea]|uniref:NACHT domain-containing protein n=1 Tax=Bionectria ochroleuca TaxID=29856 RepID=A0ABY6V2D8_BIOOC|nr:unnamed protein product [Clonostachys rosea]